MSTAAEKANLARIRDNQRRSRARRKEYLQELEARLRQCELQGIEASAEIQVAARTVADENKKLRALLHQHGVGNDVIEAALQNDNMMAGHGTTGVPHSSHAVQTLEHLLATKKSFPADTSYGMGTITVNPQGGGSRDSSVSTVPSIWEQPHTRRASEGIPSGSQHSHANQYLTPRATTSRTPSVGLGHQSSSSMQSQPQQSHQQVQRLSSMPASISSSGVANSPRDHQQSQGIFDFDPSQMYQQHTGMPSHNQLRQNHMQQNHMQQNRGQYISASSANTNSCLYASDMITSMAGGDPTAVRQELGCAGGDDCQVDNQLVFNVMDRYTGVGM